MITIFCLLIIGIVSNCGGNLIEKLNLPSLIGMMIIGMLIGPSYFDLVPISILEIAPTIKDIALVTVLFIGGLGISMNQIKLIGTPAILLSIIPATLEGFTVALLTMYFLDFTFIQGAILGFIIAAVSPAVLIPSMVSLIKRGAGKDKAIPQMLLVGASADDTIAITLFTTFLGIYLNDNNNGHLSIISNIISIPITIILSIISGFIVFKVSKLLIMKINNKNLKVFIVFLICIIMRYIEKASNVELYNSFLAIIIYGFLIRNFLHESSQSILENMNHIWRYGKIYLFSFVGMAINPSFVGEYLLIGIFIIMCSLLVRSIGVLISLSRTNLNLKEKLFCVIAYLPKATVQSAKASIPLQMGVVGGEIMQAIAILSVLITAPIGAIGIRLTSDKLLNIKSED